ncbi:MAG: T9SS type A sorting domain-containing protein [Bacteroidales bacterium]|nr:T9SS type A sorting domain-containing protein [Bacteroidales bacterium]
MLITLTLAVLSLCYVKAQNYALQFDGTNDYISVPYSSSLDFTEFTVEMWIYRTLSGVDQKVLGNADSNYPRRGFCLGISDGNKLYPEVFNSGSTNVQSTEALPLNEWAHIAVTWKKGNYSDGIKGYINGKEVISTSTVDNSMNTTNGWTIGSASWFREKYFAGKIDEIRIWNKVRTADEIRQNMYKKMTGIESNLVACYNFDNTSGTTLNDSSSYGNNGTLTNMVDADWVASSAFNTWLGSTSDWLTASNWYCVSVPVASDNVGIYSGVTYAPSLSSIGNCGNLYVGSESSLSIEPTGKLSVSGTLTNDGTLTIASNSTGTGSLISGDVTSGTGSTVVERYMTKDAWHILSSPTPDQTVGSFLSSNSTIMDNPSEATQKAFKDYNESTNTWNSLTAYSTNSTDLMGTGKGYSVWPDVTGVVSFTGTPLSSSQSKSLVRTGDNGWNCIGNPYTSSVAINRAASASNNFIDLNSSNIDDNYAAIYVWEQSSYQYTIINHSSDAFYAPVGQGFFVKAAATGTIGFASTMQSHQTGVSLRSATVVPQISIRASLNGKQSTTTVKFLENTTSGLDVGYDAGVMKTGFDVYTRLVEDNGVDFGIQCLPVEADVSYVIPVGLETTAGGAVEFQLNTIDMPAGYMVTFEDAQNGTSTEVSDNQKVLIVDMSAGNNLDRFSLKVSATVTGQKNVSENPMVVTKSDEICIYGAKAGEATLYNLQGLCVRRINLIGTTVTRIQTKGLAGGVYLLKLNQRGSTETQKIVLNK